MAAAGRAILTTVRNTGRALLMLFEAFFHMRSMFGKRMRHEVMNQMYIAGVKSLGVITVVGMFTGMILALQTGLELRRFGLQQNIGTAVAVSMLREMGPFMTALIIAASVGSAIAAQMGTMVVAEEIAALEIMSINPVRFLVMPRLVALMVMMPLLTVYTNMVGIFGGAVIGTTQLEVTMTAYFDNARLYVVNKDLYVGLLKAMVFGIVITTVACHQGFATREGAVGVGQATRRTVIISFLTILILGYIITRMFYTL
ncbi:MAG TPA: ABC transporter permease [Kiritimatiellia bacterium]|nr:ABC transporter permease [Kiritimatiellia bacterium]HMP35137.1 ABC transporter permease [Kiritimatiellia bacterium]